MYCCVIMFVSLGLPRRRLAAASGRLFAPRTRLRRFDAVAEGQSRVELTARLFTMDWLDAWRLIR